MSPHDWLSAAEIEQRQFAFRLIAVKAALSAFGQQIWHLTLVVPHPLFGFISYGVSLPRASLEHEQSYPWEHWYRLRTLPTLDQGMQMAQLVPLSPEEEQQEQTRLQSVPAAPHLYPNRHYLVTLDSDIGVASILRVQRGNEAWQHLVAVNGIAIEDLTQPEATATVGTTTRYLFKVYDCGTGFAQTSARGLLQLAALRREG